MSKHGALALRADGLTRSGGIPDRPAVAPVLIRRQTHSHIVNIWMILIVLAGAAIAFADGLRRVSILERAEAWNGPLEYEPYLAAVLFAGLTFPLMIVYVGKARVSLSEGLLLWFVFCTAAYTRDFSYVRWPGAPLFVTDVVLLSLLLFIYVLRRQRLTGSPLPSNVLLVLFLGAGALSAARGFWGHREPILVLRDSALVVYALFLLVAYHVFRSWLSIKRVALWFALGTALSALNGLAWFIAAPAERRFIYYGIYILISLVGTTVAMARRLLPPGVGWILVGVLSIGLMLANARSLFVSLAILLFLGMLGGRSIWRKIRTAHLISTLVTATALTALAAFLFLRTEAGRDFAERSSEELASGVLNSGEDLNWQFRLSAWKEAWRRFEEYPLAGEGFGAPFTFDQLLFDNDPRPHNTFLTVLYKMGLIGLLPLLVFLFYFFWITLRAVRRNLENRRVAFLQIVVLSQLAFCFYGAANLVLESPFLASLFWTTSGLGLRMVRMLDFERSLPRIVNGRGYRNEDH
jgi:O-antigen ligase